MRIFLIAILLSFLMSTVHAEQQVVIVTAYTASIEECGKDDGITASGEVAVEGVTVAADHLPLGTQILIDGNVYVVQDRLGANYRNRIDIYMDSVSRANNFGRREMIIEILEDEECEKHTT